jgi:hypothetical protein
VSKSFYSKYEWFSGSETGIFLKIQWKKEKKNPSVKNCLFLSQFLIFELRGKGHKPSRAELKILQLELWLSPAQLGLITSK